MFERTETLLRKVEVFSRLSSDDLQKVAGLCRERSYRKNQPLFYEGDPGGMLHIISTGRVKAVMEDDEGHELILSVLGPGEILGEVTLIDGGPRSATVIAVERTSTLILGRDEFMALVHHNPCIADSLLTLVCLRLRRANKLLWEVLFLDVGARLANVLLDLALKEGRPVGEELHVDLHISRQDLASMIGASREATSRALRLLQHRGLIRVKGRTIIATTLLQQMSSDLVAF